MRRCLLLVILLLIPASVSAQAFLNPDVYTISATPLYPRPNTQITIKPVSGSVDLTNAVMRVSVNKKQTYEGNARSVSVPVGAAGSVTTIDVVMESQGKSYPKQLTIRPQDVILIPEPVATVPHFYLGKPSVPLEGSIRVIAMANLRTRNGTPINPDSLSYSWTVDNTRIAGSSGIGKDSLLVASPLQYRSRRVSVSVQSQDGTAQGGAAINLSPVEPTIRFYEQDALLGTLTARTVTKIFSIGGSEKTLLAGTYGFPSTGRSVAPTLRWFLNGAAAQTGSSITLRPTGSGEGNASLSLVASSGPDVTTTKKLTVSFGAARSGFGIFGL